MDSHRKFSTRIFRSQFVGSTLGTGAAILFAASPAYSQETANDDAYIANLKACQTITEDSARLSCYDTAVGKVVTASDEGEVRIVSEEEVKKTRRGLFGLNIGLFGGDEKDKLDLLESVITDVSVSGSTVFITIEDGGAVWKIPNAKVRTRMAKPGQTVVFKKGALGSYFIRINGKTGQKGSRVR